MRLLLGKHGGLCQFVELASVNKALQDILLDVKIVVANGREPVMELGEVFDGLFDPIGGHVISSRLGAQAQMIADVLFEGAVCACFTNNSGSNHVSEQISETLKPGCLCNGMKTPDH